MSPRPGGSVCPNGHVVGRWRPENGCRICRAELSLAETAGLLARALPGLGGDARAVTEDVAGSALARNQLRAWLAGNPDGLRSGDSDCPVAAARLIAELARRGFDVTAPRCRDCGRARRLPAKVDGGRVCQDCYQQRRREPCSRCGALKKVTARDADRRAICLSCRSADPATWRPCGRCGRAAQTVAVEHGVVVGRCCYVPPLLRCTVCGTRKGERPYKTRRPICATCTREPRVACDTCGLDAPPPTAQGEPARCARCHRHPPAPCRACGTPTVGRDRDGDARCPDCYQRPVGTCGRCGRARPIVRLARDDDPDLCGICWRGPVMACEGCGRVGPCRGERKGQMLCISCQPVTPQACAHCGHARQAAAHWHEGPVCGRCYNRALAAKADCPRCGQHRRLRHYPGHDHQTCADCAGQPATHVCTLCGVEDLLYERGLCSGCVLPRRLNDLLGDPAGRQRTGLAPLFDALAGASEPKAVLDWLAKTPTITGALARIARRELPLSYKTIDQLETQLGPRTVRHLEHLLTATGTLGGRDPVLAATERWCNRLLDGIGHDDHTRLLRTYTRWQLLRPLRDKATRTPLTDATGHAVRSRLKTIASFCHFLTQRGRALATCHQRDIDDWTAAQPPHQAQPLHHFANWAAARKAMPPLDVPTHRTYTPAVPLDSDQRWATARRLLHHPGIDPALRLAGSLVVIYAQPVAKISRLSVSDLTATPTSVTVRFGHTAIELPDPLAGHARQALTRRQPHPRKAKLADDPGWLFPGRAPGRPISASGLSDQLRRHGIAPARQRLTALHQLAAEIPAPLLADILGINPRTANTWSQLAGRTWTDYPHMRANP